MTDIKYRFAMLNKDLIDIVGLDEDVRRGGNYQCLGCSSPLIPVLGDRRQRHFRHRSENISCSYEGYLHRTAKQFLFHSYQYRLQSDTPFDVVAASRVCNYYDQEYLITCELPGDHLGLSIALCQG